jgi:hypothetical protein
LIHLGTTGRLTYWDKAAKDDNEFFGHPLAGAEGTTLLRHTPTSVSILGWGRSHYRDIRKFGKWRLYRPEEFTSKEYWSLGLELKIIAGRSS